MATSSSTHAYPSFGSRDGYGLLALAHGSPNLRRSAPSRAGMTGGSSPMTIAMQAVFSAVCLFFALLLFLELGRRWGARQLERDPDGARTGTGAIEGAVFAL